MNCFRAGEFFPMKNSSAWLTFPSVVTTTGSSRMSEPMNCANSFGLI